MHVFTKNLLTWYGEYGRKLPWRETQDPYKIMVSEFMLQQTQVSRVIPKYHAFLKRFPTVYSLAESELGEVLTYWSGLGYNRRAKFLWQASKDIVERHNGKVPQDQKELESLHGFGPYTASAVRAFAFNLPSITIDANVKNVFNKVFGLTEAEIPAKVEECLPEQSRDFYNALMDIGSTYFKSNSDYENYPFKEFCHFYNDKPIPELKKVKQKSFKDSNRFYRGQLMKLLVQKKRIPLATLDEKTTAVISQLVEEELVACDKEAVYLK